MSILNKDQILVDEACSYLAQLCRARGGSLLIVAAIPTGRDGAFCPVVTQGNPAQVGAVLSAVEARNMDQQGDFIGIMLTEYAKH
jgi:hypothetical protein